MLATELRNADMCAYVQQVASLSDEPGTASLAHVARTAATLLSDQAASPSRRGPNDSAESARGSPRLVSSAASRTLESGFKGATPTRVGLGSTPPALLDSPTLSDTGTAALGEGDMSARPSGDSEWSELTAVELEIDEIDGAIDGSASDGPVHVDELAVTTVIVGSGNTLSKVSII